MRESEFIERIDSRLPYRRSIEWRRLSAQAARISPNAAFMVLHEACRPPRSVRLGKTEAMTIVRHVCRRFRHPLLRVLAPAIEAHVSGNELRPAAAARLMRKVAAYPDQYNALAIGYFSANDRTGALELVYDRVVETWGRR